MEARLGALVQVGGQEPRDEGQKEAVDAAEAVAAVYDRREDVARAKDGEGAPNAWPDESAESAALSELRERGEKSAAAQATELVEETDSKNLPSLDELVKRLPPDVREALNDLFRVKFTGVRRIPAKSLKA